MKKLNELSDGSCGRVVAINGDAHFQSRVTSIGLTIGCPFEEFKIRKSGPFWCTQGTRWLPSTKRNLTKSWWR